MRRKTTYEMKFSELHLESVKAVMETLGIKVKDIADGLRFKATEKQFNEMVTKMAKYNIGRINVG